MTSPANMLFALCKLASGFNFVKNNILFKRHYSLAVLLVFLLASPAMSQDGWIGIKQRVHAENFAGKKFRYTVKAKTNGSATVMALSGAQVDKRDGSWGYFNNGADKPVYKDAWTTRVIEGTVDSGAISLNLGLVCMGNGSCFFDSLRLQIEEGANQWKDMPLSNPGFEATKLLNGLPQGWEVAKPSPNFIFSFSTEVSHNGSNALAITGFGNEASDAITFMKGAATARERYNKTEYLIPMRDGRKLFTAVYTPKDASATKRYPMVLHRTPYSIAPYGNDNFHFRIGPSTAMMEEGYIFVHQDVRGRFKSEGLWTNMTPHLPHKKSANDVDESTDTWDTIDWLLKNIASNNGRVGQWGISYPGFYASAGSINAHPALKAVSPQAPVADYWFDDFHHNGAFTQGYLPFFPIVGTPRKEPTEEDWAAHIQHKTGDSYDFHRRIGTVKNIGDSLLQNNFLWQEMVSHPNYDTFWKARRITDHLTNLKPAYLIVGGWFDAEDLYGTLTTYKEIERRNKGIYNTIVMGPFGHGDWAREDIHNRHHQIYFGDSIALFYQRNIEATFFNHFLKGVGDGATGLPEAYMFNTGSKQWQTFNSWPAGGKKQKLFLAQNERLLFDQPKNDGFSAYISDPAKPVPYTMDLEGSFGITPRNFMSEDQRFAARRPDVLVFESEVLEKDMTVGGEITVQLHVSTTGTDADWVVKVIDVYPDDEPSTPHTPKGVLMGGYQQLVRANVMRSRWRASCERPLPMVPNKVTVIKFPLQDVLHTFKKGHRLMVQVQSTWYPLIDLNPQSFVPNIYKAEKRDFRKATHKVYHSTAYSSYVEVNVLGQD